MRFSVDIFDGDKEPTIYHGRTFTSKVSLRDACKAIAKYAFVTSPFPIIISAEVHCGLVQQEMIATIMKEEFGDALVTAPVNGRPKIEALPSPEELKGRVLLKVRITFPFSLPDLLVDSLTYLVDTSSRRRICMSLRGKGYRKRI